MGDRAQELAGIEPQSPVPYRHGSPEKANGYCALWGAYIRVLIIVRKSMREEPNPNGVQPYTTNEFISIRHLLYTQAPRRRAWRTVLSTRLSRPLVSLASWF